MDEQELAALKRENQRLREALIKITEKQAEIQAILDEISDLTEVRKLAGSTPLTDEDVKNLLKKYSRLS